MKSLKSKLLFLGKKKTNLVTIKKRLQTVYKVNKFIDKKIYFLSQ